MAHSNQIIAMADRVLRIEPQLRIALDVVRQTAHDAIQDVWRNIAYRSTALENDHDFQVWAAVHAANRVFVQQLDNVVAKIADNLQNQANLTSDVEDSERRELSLELYREYESLKTQLVDLVNQRDVDLATVDAANLSCARVLRIKVCSLQDARLKQIAQSAVDCALAASHLARRVAVVKEHPPTMADASWS
jgi:methionyl-tRNA synthetase